MYYYNYDYNYYNVNNNYMCSFINQYTYIQYMYTIYIYTVGNQKCNYNYSYYNYKNGIKIIMKNDLKNHVMPYDYIIIVR